MIVHRDCAYATLSAAQRLDLYLPLGAGPHPLVIWVHGGGWLTGSRDLPSGAPQLRLLARGAALASVGYRLSAEAHFPAQIHDISTAVSWLRTHGAEHSIRTDRIGAWGASAGGHLVALLGTSHGSEALAGRLGWLAASSSVEAVVDWYGPTDFLAMDRQTAELGCPPFARGGHDDPRSPESRLMGGPIQEMRERVREADPAAWVHPAVPPFLIQHGTRDCTVPWLQSRYLTDRIKEAAGPGRVVLETLDEGHGGPAFDAAENVDHVIDFLLRHIVPARHHPG